MRRVSYVDPSTGEVVDGVECVHCRAVCDPAEPWCWRCGRDPRRPVPTAQGGRDLPWWAR